VLSLATDQVYGEEPSRLAIQGLHRLHGFPRHANQFQRLSSSRGKLRIIIRGVPFLLKQK